jgi:hypothetical protein
MKVANEVAESFFFWSLFVTQRWVLVFSYVKMHVQTMTGLKDMLAQRQRALDSTRALLTAAHADTDRVREEGSRVAAGLVMQVTDLTRRLEQQQQQQQYAQQQQQVQAEVVKGGPRVEQVFSFFTLVCERFNC